MKKLHAIMTVAALFIVAECFAGGTGSAAGLDHEGETSQQQDKPQTKVTTSGGIRGGSGDTRATSRTDITRTGQIAEGRSRWRIGGGIGFDFSDNYFHLGVSPELGYAIADFLVLGAGINYNLVDWKNRTYSDHYFGLNCYMRGYIIRYIVAEVKPEVRWRMQKHHDGTATTTNQSASVLIGGGLTYPVAPGSYISAMLYYDLLQSQHSPYGDKIFYSVGYTFRF